MTCASVAARAAARSALGSCACVANSTTVHAGLSSFAHASALAVRAAAGPGSWQSATLAIPIHRIICDPGPEGPNLVFAGDVMAALRQAGPNAS